MHRTVTTPDALSRHWAGVHNFLLDGDGKPFDYALPEREPLIDALRHDPEVIVYEAPDRVGKNRKVRIDDEFRDQPLADALRRRFALRHMDILKFDRPDGLLEGFSTAVIQPLYEMLIAVGFTWYRFVPYIMSSGPGGRSALHADRSHVIAWQVYGRKQFAGFKDPTRWLTREMRREQVLAPDPNGAVGYDVPDEVTDDDWLVYDMGPGDVLWNAFNTLHVVTGGDEPSLSVNISIRGLRHRGALCPHERDLMEFQDEKAHLSGEASAAAY